MFAEDVLSCPCGGRRRVLSFITDTDVARQILTALGLPAIIPTVAPACAPPQPSFDDWQGQAKVPDDDIGGDIGDHPVDHPPDDVGDPPAWDETSSV